MQSTFLTKRQKEVLDFIKRSINDLGYAPSLIEIKEEFKLKAISTVHEHLENLKKKGFIKKNMNQPRGIFVVDQKTKQVEDIPISYSIQNHTITKLKKIDDTIPYIKKKKYKNTKYICIRIQDNSLLEFNMTEGDVLIASKDHKTNLQIVKENQKICIKKTHSNIDTKSNFLFFLVKLERHFKQCE